MRESSVGKIGVVDDERVADMTLSIRRRQQHCRGTGLRQQLAILRIGQKAQLVGFGVLQSAQAGDDSPRIATQASACALCQLTESKGDDGHAQRC